jgi:hypothetical protein
MLEILIVIGVIFLAYLVYCTFMMPIYVREIRNLNRAMLSQLRAIAPSQSLPIVTTPDQAR